MGLRAAILCTGTELTSGEIVNTNGAWLGEKLEDLGFRVTSQVLVPDDRTAIAAALDWIKPQADLIIVGGGIGPTSDDLTREVVAQWAGKELVFSEREWQAMNELYAKRHMAIRPAHRHQCHFPADSRTLPNSVGTALGFTLDVKGVRLVIVPGPPRELQGMWDDHVEPVIKELSPRKETELLVWTLMGVTESEAAEASEEAVMGSGLTMGYRASIPYVRVKLWLPWAMGDRDKWKSKLENALKPWVVARGKEDLLHAWIAAIKSVENVNINDGITAGRLASRIFGLTDKKIPWPANLTVSTGGKGAEAGRDVLNFSLSPGRGSSSFLCELKYQDKVKVEELEIPFKTAVQSPRGVMYASEWALRWCLKTMPSILS